MLSMGTMRTTSSKNRQILLNLCERLPDYSYLAVGRSKRALKNDNVMTSRGVFLASCR